MVYTENYKLAKPEGALKFDPDYDNGNYDIIDAALKANAVAAEAAQSAAESAQTAAENAQKAAVEANAAIGDIATLLDTINGEVI